MGYTHSKIYRLKTYFVLFLISILHITLLAEEDIGGVFYRVVFPFYQDNGDLPLVILRCEKAKPIGIRIEMEGVILDWIGDSVKDIKGVVKTPSAVYDKNTQKVTGNEKITYRSSGMDLDGVGFDIDQVKQLIHIRSKVKVVLKSRLKHERGMRKRASQGKISIARSREKLVIERIDDGKDKDKQKSKPEREVLSESGSWFDWSSLIWFFALIVIVVIIIKFLHRKQARRGPK